MPYYIIDPANGQQIEVTEEVYRLWAAANNITTSQGDPVVGGINKTSVSSNTGVVTGSSTVVQPGSGTGTTTYLRAAGEPGSEYTAAQRRAAQEDRERIAAIARANALWAGFRALAGLREAQQLDGGGGGYPEVTADDPYANEDFIEPGYFDDGPGDAADPYDYNAPAGGPGIDDAFDIDPRTDVQVAADDAAIEAATGIRINNNNVTDDPYAPSGTAPGGPGIDDTFAGDTRTPEQILADDRLIAIATGVRIDGATDVFDDPYAPRGTAPGGPGIDDTFAGDTRTPEQILADDRLIAIATGVRIDGATDVFDDPYAPRGTAAGGPGIDDTFAGDTRTPGQIAADDRAIEIATGIKITNATDIQVASVNEFGQTPEQARNLTNEVFYTIQDFTPSKRDQVEAQINNIQTLLDTDGFGSGLSADDRSFLEDRLARDTIALQAYQSNDSLTQAANFVIQEARYLSDAVTDTGTSAARQLVTDFLETLTPDQRATLQANEALSANLLQASGIDFPLYNDGTITQTPGSGADSPFTTVQSEIDRAVAAWVSEFGSISDSDYARIEAEVVDQYGGKLRDQNGIVVAAGVERDPDTRGVLQRTSASTTVPAGDTNTVLIGNDTPGAVRSPSEFRVESVAPGGVGSVYVSRYDPATRSYDVVNATTGQVVAGNLTRQQAEQEAEQANESEPRPAEPPPPEPPVRDRQAAAAPVGGNFTESFNPETGSYDVVNTTTGQVVATGLTEQQAILEAQNASIGDPSYGSSLRTGLTEEQIQTQDNPAAVVDPRTAEQIAADDAAIEAATGVKIRTPDPGVDPRTPEQIAADDAKIAAALKVQNTSPQPVSQNLTEVYNPETGTWDVIDLDSGATVATGLTEQQAILAAQNASVGVTANTPISTPPPAPGTNQTTTLAKAQAQATLAAQQKQANQGDWRVKLRLAPGANYLYRANDGKGTQAGILQPLAVTDGVVFPYTPVISTNYRANYNTYDLTHSNYRGYFYQGSTVEELTIQAMFTAQDTYEANYLLAVIHFFKSVTKMFYGQDPERGTPPPLVYLQGLGEYQFNLHPCLVTSFNYTLPNDVDYIRARSPNINGTNLLQARQRQTVASNPFSEIIQRLQNAGLPRGGINTPPPAPTLGTNSPTYVPTKLDMTITLLPVQSREQQSKQFSLKQYANGDLLKGGFW